MKATRISNGFIEIRVAFCRETSAHVWKCHSEIYSRQYASSFLWVYYSREGLDRNGEVMVGSWEVEPLWRVARGKSGQWKLYDIDIKEQP